MKYNKDVDMLAQAYQLITEATHKCDKCGKPMGKHQNEEKAKKGYKYCQSCDRTYSPEAQTDFKKSWAGEEQAKKDK